ncbi:MAG: hypothetical protein A2039_01390 [Candidatus Melainabacteria bacterium GWA2_34_9]|nr:MAG: hypothetical protein A2039_01390 [Candidatus Melainabacteria bacterium GWA2_34_9]
MSEILITLVLMGTVMALTIPSMTQRTNKNAYVAGLKKTYGVLDTATSQIMTNNAGTLIQAFPDSDEIVTKYCSILECNKICTAGNSVSDGCFNAQADIRMLNDLTFIDDPNSGIFSGFVLADGILVTAAIVGTAGACDYTYMGVTSICGWINLDVNGIKGPNIFGKDIFTFDITKDKIIPTGLEGSRTDYSLYCDQTSANVQNGEGCAGRVLTEGAMNY